MRPYNALRTIQVNEHDKYALWSINPQVFPLQAVISAANALANQATVLIDGDPETEILAEIYPKGRASLKDTIAAFNDRLLKYADGTHSDKR